LLLNAKIQLFSVDCPLEEGGPLLFNAKIQLFSVDCPLLAVFDAHKQTSHVYYLQADSVPLCLEIISNANDTNSYQ